MQRIGMIIGFLGSALFAQAQQFVLTEGQLAKDLGVSKRELERQSKILAKHLSGNANLNSVCRSNGAQTPNLCRLIVALELFKDEDKKFENNRDVEKQDYARVPRHLGPKNFSLAQEASVDDLLGAMKEIKNEEIMSWFPKLLNYKQCPQNLMLATMRVLETALPSMKAQASIELGYKQVSKCLSEKNPSFEFVHFRQALLRLLWGDRSGAQNSLKLALRSTNSRYKENVLYWLGFLEKNPKVRSAYWDHLIEEYPLSFQALTASKLEGRDLFENFLTKPLIRPQRATKDTLAQLGIYWLEALYMYGENKGAMTLSFRLSKRFFTRYSSANTTYMAALADRYNLPDVAMSYSSFLVKRNPYLLNPQTLRYLYPKPFSSIFEKTAQKLDPLLTFSVAKQESGFNPNARSPANARGILQILPSTAKSYDPGSHKFLYDVDTNVEVGGKILADLISRLGRVDYALAAYNAGYNRVENWKKRYDTIDTMLFIDLIPYQETRGYVANVLRNHYWYSSLYGNKSSSSNKDISIR